MSHFHLDMLYSTNLLCNLYIMPRVLPLLLLLRFQIFLKAMKVLHLSFFRLTRGTSKLMISLRYLIYYFMDSS